MFNISNYIELKTRVIVLIVLFLLPVSTAKAAEPEFQFEITCNLEGYYQNIQIGYNNSASTSFDQQNDLIAPPEPPIGIRAYLQHQTTNQLFSKLTKSIVNPQSSYEWILKVESKGVAGQLNISWTNTPENIIITINDGQHNHIVTQNGEMLLDVQSGSTTTYTIQVQTQTQSPEITPTTPTTPDEHPDQNDTVKEPDETNTTEPKIPQLNQTETITPPATENQENNEPIQLKEVEITELSVNPNPANTKEEITLTITLYNPETTPQQYTTTIYIDAEMIQAKTITIQPETEKEIVHTFSMTTPGDHTIQVNEKYQRFTVKTASPIPFSIIPVIIGITLASINKRTTKYL